MKRDKHGQLKPKVYIQVDVLYASILSLSKNTIIIIIMAFSMKSTVFHIQFVMKNKHRGKSLDLRIKVKAKLYL